MAQNLMVCQFCETSNETKYKCVNCDLILCEGCKIKIHTKIKKTEVHQVIDLKEFSNLGASETIRHLDLRDITCSIHDAEHCIIYCEDCKVLLCAVCLLESHRTHNLTKIDEVYNKKVIEFQELDNKILKELPFYTDFEKELKKIKSVENDQYNEMKQKILKKESELKENISKQRENLITELDRMWVPREEEIRKQLKDTVEKSDALKKMKAQIGETFQSHNATAIFTASGKLDNELPTRPANTISEQKLLFSETGTLDDKKEFFGIILSIPDYTITESFTSETLDSIYNIKTLENNTNILCTSKTSTLKSFELKDSKCITTSIANDNEVNIIDMTKAQDNKLFFTVVTSSEIKCLSTFKPDSKIETFTSISPLYARGIHATNKNILVGFKDNGKLLPLQEKSRRGILVYDYNCRHMRTYEYDTNNQRLFSLPDVITTNINEDICVIDSINSTTWEGRVVVLGKYGNLKCIYNGHAIINSKNYFIPIDLITTSKGLILVSDRDSNTIHMLSMDGCLVTSLNESHGIEKPYALNINQSGQLQIGCSSKGTKSELGKLLTVDISFLKKN
ncbi:unnamed protein product [Mytilus coruscus]|uniref:B box-type domain-containing protein n=1 Tax=Mytilus coruscus TaxID=42192 RepID=A0A6J8DN90_MYTCO|nr:unnamed protein product [Mytilus coruscus]